MPVSLDHDYCCSHKALRRVQRYAPSRATQEQKSPIVVQGQGQGGLCKGKNLIRVSSPPGTKGVFGRKRRESEVINKYILP